MKQQSQDKAALSQPESGDTLSAAIERALAKAKVPGAGGYWADAMDIAAFLLKHGIAPVVSGRPEHEVLSDLGRMAETRAHAIRSKTNGKKGGRRREREYVERALLRWCQVQWEMQNGAKSANAACRKVARKELKEEKSSTSPAAIKTRGDLIYKAIRPFEEKPYRGLYEVLFGVDAARCDLGPTARQRTKSPK